jgi:hypothetical protein
MWVDLTYPGEFPHDGREVKRHLAAFFRRCGHTLSRLYCVWKLEVQARGAPHFHMVLWLPGETDKECFNAWLSQSWYQVVGSNDPAHLGAGTRCDWYQAKAGGFAEYFTGYAASKSKEYQHHAPEWLTDLGRWWGVRGLKPETQERELTPYEALQWRRMLVKYRKAELRRKLAEVRTWKEGTKKEHERKQRALRRVLRQLARLHKPQQGGFWVIGGRHALDLYGQLASGMDCWLETVVKVKLGIDDKPFTWRDYAQLREVDWRKALVVAKAA